MCGIAGIYDKAGVQESDLRRMTDAIGHRGPDAEGCIIHDGFGLGHRRLSIIDLSESANQPMQSNCKRYWIAYNGEVYNHKSVAKELSQNLNTTSDTEVILEAFVKWGPSMVNKLNGMFPSPFLTPKRTNFTFLETD